MTGPEPGDLAEITWEAGGERRCVNAIRTPDGWFDGMGTIHPDCIQAVRPLSVVPTDSLEGLAERIEKSRAGMFQAPYRNRYRDGWDDAKAADAAAVRSAITKPTTED